MTQQQQPETNPEEAGKLDVLRQLVQKHWQTLPPDFGIARQTFSNLIDFIDANLVIAPPKKEENEGK